jgi:hypothetical protein
VSTVQISKTDGERHNRNDRREGKEVKEGENMYFRIGVVGSAVLPTKRMGLAVRMFVNFPLKVNRYVSLFGT